MPLVDENLESELDCQKESGPHLMQRPQDGTQQLLTFPLDHTGWHQTVPGGQHQPFLISLLPLIPCGASLSPPGALPTQSSQNYEPLAQAVDQVLLVSSPWHWTWIW